MASILYILKNKILERFKIFNPDTDVSDIKLSKAQKKHIRDLTIAYMNYYNNRIICDLQNKSFGFSLYDYNYNLYEVDTRNASSNIVNQVSSIILLGMRIPYAKTYRCNELFLHESQILRVKQILENAAINLRTVLSKNTRTEVSNATKQIYIYHVYHDGTTEILDQITDVMSETIKNYIDEYRKK
jgi:hypothetical protein